MFAEGFWMFVPPQTKHPYSIFSTSLHSSCLWKDTSRLKRESSLSYHSACRGWTVWTSFCSWRLESDRISWSSSAWPPAQQCGPSLHTRQQSISTIEKIYCYTCRHMNWCVKQEDCKEFTNHVLFHFRASVLAESWKYINQCHNESFVDFVSKLLGETTVDHYKTCSYFTHAVLQPDNRRDALQVILQLWET